VPDVPTIVDFSAERHPTPIHDRLERAPHRQAVAQAQQAGQSQRAAAASAGVARGTLRHWNTPAEPSAAAPAGLAAFCETPEGVEWLRRVPMAAHWSISEQGGAGVRVVCQFLELSGLLAFIAASSPFKVRLTRCNL
jgi:hypothetical protein